MSEPAPSPCTVIGVPACTVGEFYRRCRICRQQKSAKTCHHLADKYPTGVRGCETPALERKMHARSAHSFSRRLRQRAPAYAIPLRQGYGGREASAGQGKKEGRRVSPCIAAGRSQGLAQENNFSLRVMTAALSLRCVGRQDRSLTLAPFGAPIKILFLPATKPVDPLHLQTAAITSPKKQEEKIP